MKPYLGIIASLQLFLCAPLWATDQIGTLTQVEGVVKIYSHPSKTLHTEAGKAHALYEGDYYTVQEAKIGDHIEKGSIVQTAPGAKARVVYDNGDQFHVGPGTAYRVSWDKDAGDGRTQVNLAYGKLRGIIEKGGPRSHLKIKTRSAVMGVRGTDFFIAQGGSDESTEVSILRGAVEVTPVAAPTQAKPVKTAHSDKNTAKNEKATEGAKTIPATPVYKPIEVTAGQTAEVGPATAAPEKTEAAASETSSGNSKDKKAEAVSPTVELRKLTQEDLNGIQKSSTFQTKSSETGTSPETQKKIEELEKKATVTVLKDIQKTDKDLYESLKKDPEKIAKLEEANQASLQKILKTAPPAPEKRKPYKSEIEDIGNGAYEKYFRNID